MRHSFSINSINCRRIIFLSDVVPEFVGVKASEFLLRLPYEVVFKFSNSSLETRTRFDDRSRGSSSLRRALIADNQLSGWLLRASFQRRRTTAATPRRAVYVRSKSRLGFVQPRKRAIGNSVSLVRQGKRTRRRSLIGILFSSRTTDKSSVVARRGRSSEDDSRDADFGTSVILPSSLEASAPFDPYRLLVPASFAPDGA